MLLFLGKIAENTKEEEIKEFFKLFFPVGKGAISFQFGYDEEKNIEHAIVEIDPESRDQIFEECSGKYLNGKSILLKELSEDLEQLIFESDKLREEEDKQIWLKNLRSEIKEDEIQTNSSLRNSQIEIGSQSVGSANEEVEWSDHETYEEALNSKEVSEEIREMNSYDDHEINTDNTNNEKREWLIILEGYTSEGIRVEYKYFKDDSGYELIRYGVNTSVPRTFYKTNVELVKGVLNDVGGWLFVKQVPMKYAEFWKKTFKKNNRKYPTGELLE